MRTLLGGLLSLSLVSVLACGVGRSADKAEDVTNRAEQFKTLKADWEKAVKEFVKAYRAAENDEQRQKVLDKEPDGKAYAKKLQKLIDVDPKDDLALEMLTFQLLGLRDFSEKALDTLTKYHAASPKIADVLEPLANGAPSEAKGLLDKVLADNPDKRAKGFACAALAMSAVEAQKTKEAEKLFVRIEHEFADIKTRRGTLGDIAKGNLFEIRNLNVGMKAPDVESMDLDGKKTKLSDYKGKVVVLDIWATWCGPCRAMIPHEREMVKKLADKPFTLISVSADDDRDDVKQFLKKESMPWVHWWAGDEGIVKNWNVRFFPTIYVIDAKGVIRHKHIREKELEEAVEKLVAEAEGKK